MKNKIIFVMIIISLFIFVSGILCNKIALDNNGGRMPVLTNRYVNSGEHFNFVNSAEVNVYYLTDILKIEKNKVRYFSIGDILLYSGGISLFIFVTIGMVRMGFFKIKEINKKT